MSVGSSWTWLAAVVALAASGSLAAEVRGARIALVVGNGAYGGELGALRNPVNDARLMARTLHGVGFAVRLVEDADETALEDAVVAFGGDLRQKGSGGVALFYYAGHGVQSSGANYLIPVHAQVESERHLRTRTVPATLVLQEMEEAPTALNIVVLDACRNNPYSASGRSVGGSRGLVRMDTPPGSFFLAYSAAAGQVAEDGDGANSVYTGALATAMMQPGLELEEVFRQAGRTVRTQTGGSQVPWREGSWDGVFHFVPPGTGPVVPEPVAEPGMDPEQEEWRFVRNSGNPDVVRDFLERHPNGRLAGAARALLAQLSVWPFTVATEPAGARIRLADRSERYQPGMRLPAGDYRVEVSADGYETRMVTVRHDSPTTHPVVLRKAGPKAGDRFLDCPECPEMVVLPAGSYRMGSPSEWEGPVHDVTIVAPFAIARHEVTVVEFGRFVDSTKYSVGDRRCSTPELSKETLYVQVEGWRKPGFDQSGRHPVTCVSWREAQAYVAWLSKETEEEYRLPSESEWEYAARAGSVTALYWGKSESDQCRYANSVDVSLKKRYEERYAYWPWEEWERDGFPSCRDGYIQTSPVGSFAANDWGLHDMVGNVAEWVEDCWKKSYVGAPSDGSAWKWNECNARTTRGGGWETPSLAVTERLGYQPSSRTNYIGFRVARTLTP